MKKEIQRNFIVTAIVFLLFVIFTIVVKCVDVQAIGPENSKVGLASLNGWIRDTVGVHEAWYHLTKYMGVIVLLVAAGFVAFGVIQLIQGKSLFKVDVALVLMAGVYAMVGIAYVLFEVVVINYRPVILDAKEGLEASYPSSHTMLSVCVMASAMIFCMKRIRDARIRNAAMAVASVVMAVVVVGRLISGVHWFTDIVGGVLLGMVLVMLYYSFLQYARSVKRRKAGRRV